MSTLVIGESVVDEIRRTFGPTLSRLPGGSPMNVAIGLARLGRKVSLLTSLGQDPDGDLLASHIRSNRVELFPGSFNARTTSVAYAQLNDHGSASYTFDIQWDPIAPPDYITEPEHCPRALHVGSIATLMEPGVETVKKWVEALRPHCTVFYDPNVRLSVARSVEDAKRHIEYFVSHADVVKVSDEDLAGLYNASPEDVIKEWLELGASIVVITRGAQPALIANHAITATVPIVPTKVVDTVGAGDSFMSALIDGTARFGGLHPEGLASLRVMDTDRLESLGAYAATAASITCSRAGAHPPTRLEMAEKADQYAQFYN